MIKTEYDVLLIGCFGYPNLGDELILKAWLNSLLQFNKRLKVLVDCHRPITAKSIFGDYGNRVQFQDSIWQIVWNAPDSAGKSLDYGKNFFDSINSDVQSQRFVLSRLSSIKMIIICGGGYIRDGWFRPYSLLGIVSVLKSLLRIPVVMSGQGFIPYNEEISQKFLNILDSFDHVSVRDTPSFEKIKDLSSAYQKSHLDDTFLFEASPLCKFYKPAKFEHKIRYCSDFFMQKKFIEAYNGFIQTEFDNTQRNRLIVCMQDDIKANDIHHFLLSKIKEIHENQKREIYLTEFLPKWDFQILCDLAKITRNKIHFVPFEQILNRNFYFNENDICVGTRFHFHLLAARAGARGIFGSADEYYGIKHDSIIEIGSQWQNVDLYRNTFPHLAAPLIDEKKLHEQKKVEFLHIMKIFMEHK